MRPVFCFLVGKPGRLSLVGLVGHVGYCFALAGLLDWMPGTIELAYAQENATKITYGSLPAATAVVGSRIPSGMFLVLIVMIAGGYLWSLGRQVDRFMKRPDREGMQP